MKPKYGLVDCGSRKACVRHTQVEHKLDDLHHGDVLLPPNADAPGALEVVPVHDDVDHEVEGDDGPGDGRVADELSVAEKGGRAMVVGVEEGLTRSVLIDRMACTPKTY